MAEEETTDRGTAFARLEVALEPAPEPAALEPVWRSLLARADASFFLSWPWIGTWLEHAVGPRWLARITVDGALVGLALLGERRRPFGPLLLPSLHLHATGDPDADRIAIEYNDVLAARGWESAARAALVRRLFDRSRPGPGARTLVLPMVGEAFEEAVRTTGARVRRHGESRSARVDLEAVRRRSGGYLAGLGGSTRRQIKRAAELYRQRGPLAIEPAADLDQAVSWLRALAVLHEARFAASRTGGAFASASFEAFHRTLIARALPEGTVELLRISAGDRPIGYLYNFLWRGWVGYYTSGFVYEADNKLKPGLVCHWLAVEHYARTGALVYDFMAGESRYKASLAGAGPLLLTLVVEADDLRARLADGVRALRDRLRAVSGSRTGEGG